VDLAVPRDRNGSFEPRIVPKGQTRLDGFNDRIIALHARCMTTRDIRAHLREMYGVEVSSDLITYTDGRTLPRRRRGTAPSGDWVEQLR
jgi:putative transposase